MSSLLFSPGLGLNPHICSRWRFSLLEQWLSALFSFLLSLLEIEPDTHDVNCWEIHVKRRPAGRDTQVCKVKAPLFTEVRAHVTGWDCLAVVGEVLTGILL